jgi:hypothetical protein
MNKIEGIIINGERYDLIETNEYTNCEKCTIRDICTKSMDLCIICYDLMRSFSGYKWVKHKKV